MKNKLLKIFTVAAIGFMSLQPATSSANSATNANGKYSVLLQTVHCPRDASQYGNFYDYGYWGGGAWCGQQGVAGYWVWVSPNWYVWQYQN